VRGTIYATAGEIGGWSVTATQIKAVSDAVILDKDGIITVGGAGYLQSDPFTSGTCGWRITPTEAEFGNVTVRGEIRTAVFKYDEVHAQAGRLLVTGAAAKLVQDLVVGETGTLYVEDAGVFAVGDIVRLKDGTNDAWLEITDDSGGGGYAFSRESGSGPFYTGTAVVSYGASGEGGVILDAGDADAPFVDVFTHAGSPWTELTTKVRLGNLGGIVDGDLNPTGYGLYCDNVFLKGKLVWGKGSLTGDGILLDVDDASDSAWIKFGSVDNYIRGYDSGEEGVEGIEISSLPSDRGKVNVKAVESGGSYTELTLESIAGVGTKGQLRLYTPSGDWGSLRMLYQEDRLEKTQVYVERTKAGMLAGGPGPRVEVDSENNWILLQLGDNAGVHTVVVQDSDGVEVTKLDSDGCLFASRYVVQDSVDGGPTRGIRMWTATDSNWGIYMGESGAGKSLSGGVAVAGGWGEDRHAIRFRIYDMADRAVIFENGSEECLFSVGSDGAGYLKGSLKMGGSYVVQDSVDGGPTRGIRMWSAADSNWGIYMGQSGAGKSLSGGVAAAGGWGEAVHAIRFRIFDMAGRAVIFENSSEECLFSVQASDGAGYLKGSLKMGGSIDESTALGILARRSAQQAIPSGAVTPISFDTQIRDTDGGFAPTSSRLYAKHAGIYMAGGSVNLDYNVAAWKIYIVYIRRNLYKYLSNNSTPLHNAITTAHCVSTVTGMFYMAVDDFVEVCVYHNTGANQNTRAAGADNLNECSAWLVRVA